MVPRGVAVEFLGLPGAGKSALCHGVARLLSGGGAAVEETTWELAHASSPARRRLRKLAIVALELLSQPMYVLISARAIAATRQMSVADLLGTLFNWIFVSSLLRRSRRRPGVCLLDQGIFQGLWSVGFGAGRGAVALLAGRLEGRMPTPDLVVVIETSLETVERRLRDRKGRDSRLERRLQDEPGLLALSASLLQETLAVLRGLSERSGHPRLLTVTNERETDLEAAAREIVHYLEQDLGGLAAEIPGSAAGLEAAPMPRQS